MCLFKIIVVCLFKIIVGVGWGPSQRAQRGLFENVCAPIRSSSSVYLCFASVFARNLRITFCDSEVQREIIMLKGELLCSKGNYYAQGEIIMLKGELLSAKAEFRPFCSESNLVGIFWKFRRHFGQRGGTLPPGFLENSYKGSIRAKRAEFSL